MSRRRERGVQAVAAGVAGVAGSYAVGGFTPGFVPATVATAITRHSPDAVIRFAITVLGDLGRQLAVVAGFFLAVALFAGIAGGALAVGHRLGAEPLAVPLAGGGVFAVATALGSGSSAALAAAVASLLPLAVPPLAARVPSERVSPARRRTLGTVGSALATVWVGIESGVLQGPALPSRAVSDPAVRDRLDEAEAKSLDVSGLEPLVSTDFYRVDASIAAPQTTRGEWSLSVTGEVEEELDLGFATVTEMDNEERFVTLRCVGDGLDDEKMDTALWTVVPVSEILDRAGVTDAASHVMLRAADDYYQEFPVEVLESAVLAYRMNGRPLPRGHGFPVRALVPGHWGEINVKWLEEIEILDREAEGYWEKRGWHGTGPVHTVAKIETTSRESGTRTVAGHAYAGTRGVSAVEVSVDGGETWNEATLSEPLPGEDVWRQWAFEYEPSGSHEVVARAREADGTLQPQKRTEPYPSGATGWDSEIISN